jgi:hypothetical protein
MITSAHIEAHEVHVIGRKGTKSTLSRSVPRYFVTSVSLLSLGTQMSSIPSGRQ